MKKTIKIVLVLALVVSCLTAVATAEGPVSGICNVTVVSAYNSTVTIQAQKADQTPVTTTTAEGGKQVYADAVRLKLTYSDADEGSQYVVFVLDDGNTVPTESNVAYIDQNGNAVFDIYPSTLTTGKTYDIYLSSNAATGIKEAVKVASFGYYAAYTLGDVDENGTINTQDAMQCFNHFVGNIELTGNQFLAADVVKDNVVNAQDGMRILNVFAGDATFE